MSYLWNICDFAEVPDTILSLFSPFWNHRVTCKKGGNVAVYNWGYVAFSFSYFGIMLEWTDEFNVLKSKMSLVIFV